MEQIIRGTTPTFVFTFQQDFDPTAASKVIVTIGSNGQAILEKTDTDLVIDATSISVYLTQAETLAMPYSAVSAQINFLYGDGSRVATEIMQIPWGSNLHNEVME